MSRSDTGPFALIPEWVLYSPISDRALRVYAVLARHADKDGVAFPSRARLAALVQTSKASLDRARQELVEIGAIETLERVRDNGSRASNGYFLRRAESSRVSTPIITDDEPPLITDDESLTRATKNEKQPASQAGAEPTAAPLVAHFFDEARRLHVIAPNSLAGLVGRTAKNLLAEGIDSSLIAEAITESLKRGLHPGTIPSLLITITAPKAKGLSVREIIDMGLEEL